jgi:excisionase family DNA binding protein
VEQAAEALGISRTTMFALIKNGDVAAVMVGRLRRVPADEIDAYIVAQTERGATGDTRVIFLAASAKRETRPARPDADDRIAEPDADRQKADDDGAPTDEPAKPKRKSSRKRPEGTRAPNGAGSIYLGKDGKWHGRVTMGIRDDGKPDRRHVERKSEAEVIKAVKALEKQRDDGTKRKPGKAPKFGDWLDHWVENIEARTARFNTLGGHRSNIKVHLKPNLGEHRMDRMEPEHFEKLYAKIEQSGRSIYTVLGVHRTARVAFNEAVRRKVVGFNPVSLAKPGQIEEEDEVEPLEADEAQRVIAAAMRRRNGVRFVVALVFGDRQGEALGFKWERLNREKRSIRVAKQLQRQTWQHGCENPAECVRDRHKTEPCPQKCSRHTRPCPPPCAPECIGHARHCPKRFGGGLVEVPVKSKAGRRTHMFPDRLWDIVTEHEAAQRAERELAGSEWHEGGWMFTQPNGKPIDPKADRAEWKSILAEAKVDERRLHDARHTAATVLALLEIAPRITMDIMGWSDPAMLVRYGHVTDTMRRDVAQRLGAHFWGEKTEPENSPAKQE